ncbi:soluble calcium activated nucleotidase 1 [Trichuris trichiura]|uniref:Soluble calcium activated nucleotidase 1 n=1 Tax=Trichuris trichiura TaxID=36087 RepID=A0A077YZ49_TRITR|nr:soluble calcium activated nucleotidase 1 [Trichuris trichiura]
MNTTADSERKVDKKSGWSIVGTSGWTEPVFLCINLLVVGSLLLVSVYKPYSSVSSSSCQSLYGIATTDIPSGNICATVKQSDDQRSNYYRIVVISDLDHDSKNVSKSQTWVSIFQTGILRLSADMSSADVHWDDAYSVLEGSISQKGRAMELSDLKVFNGRLLSVDDRTGFIYNIVNETVAVPWIFLADGDGQHTKGFKAEWMAVKDDKLYIGGIGKEWTTVDGRYVNDDPFWVKIVDNMGHVKHVNWKIAYLKLREAIGIEYPGYMIHESAQWSMRHSQWFFLPRRASKERYSETEDEHRATNVLLRADACFREVAVTYVGSLSLTRGFSAFQFIPLTGDSLIVAVKSEEIGGIVNSYLTVFGIDGRILLPDSIIPGNFKFEGIELI